MLSNPSKIYDAGYQANSVAPRISVAYGIIAGAIVGVLRPKTAIDLGSGAGAFVCGLRSHGVFAFGVEGSVEAVKIAQANGVDVRFHDLRERNIPWTERAELVTSFDVAEHIEEQCDDGIVDAAVKSCLGGGTILFGAAPPGQDGTGHINLKHPSYWAAKFARRGWRHDAALTDELRRQIREAPPALHDPPLEGWPSTCHNTCWWVEKNLQAYNKN